MLGGEYVIGDLYFHVAGTIFGITSIMALISLIIQIIYMAYRFVDDVKDGEDILFRKIDYFKKHFERRDDSSDFFLKLLIFWLVCMVLAFCWPIVTPVGIIYGFLLLLRSMMRFKKKINAILERKADKGHMH